MHSENSNIFVVMSVTSKRLQVYGNSAISFSGNFQKALSCIAKIQPFSLSCQSLPNACMSMEIQPFPVSCWYLKALSCTAKIQHFRCHVSLFQRLARLWKFSYFLFRVISITSIMYSEIQPFSLSCQSLPNACTAMEIQPFPFSCGYRKALSCLA